MRTSINIIASLIKKIFIVAKSKGVRVRLLRNIDANKGYTDTIHQKIDEIQQTV